MRTVEFLKCVLVRTFQSVPLQQRANCSKLGVIHWPYKLLWNEIILTLLLFIPSANSPRWLLQQQRERSSSTHPSLTSGNGALMALTSIGNTQATVETLPPRTNTGSLCSAKSWERLLRKRLPHLERTGCYWQPLSQQESQLSTKPTR